MSRRTHISFFMSSVCYSPARGGGGGWRSLRVLLGHCRNATTVRRQRPVLGVLLRVIPAAGLLIIKAGGKWHVGFGVEARDSSSYGSAGSSDTSCGGGSTAATASQLRNHIATVAISLARLLCAKTIHDTPLPHLQNFVAIYFP